MSLNPIFANLTEVVNSWCEKVRNKGSIPLRFNHLAIWMFAILFVNTAQAQDERVLRYLLRKKQFKEKSLMDRTHFRLSTKWYELDLDSDKRNEKISMENNDGINYLVIRNYRNFPIFRQAFLTQAIGGIVHKLRLVQVSRDTRLLMVYYFEGVTEYLDFQATGRLYFVSWKNNDLKTIKMSRGPHYWQESKGYRGNYFNRRFKVYLKDFNSDGIKEVAVKLGTISRVYHLMRNNEWATLPPE